MAPVDAWRGISLVFVCTDGDLCSFCCEFWGLWEFLEGVVKEGSLSLRGVSRWDGSGVEVQVEKRCIVMFFILFVGFELCFGVLEGSCLTITLFFAP